jgi:hypothetical protein
MDLTERLAADPVIAYLLSRFVQEKALIVRGARADKCCKNTLNHWQFLSVVQN